MPTIKSMIESFKDKVACKKIYNELVQYLNENYDFKIDISNLNDKIIGTSEERCIYLLRETERENHRGERRTLTGIASELGCSRRVLEKDVKKMTEQGFKLMGMNIQEERKITLCDCEIIKHLVDSHKLIVKTPYANYELMDNKVIEIEII